MVSRELKITAFVLVVLALMFLNTIVVLLSTHPITVPEPTIKPSAATSEVKPEAAKNKGVQWSNRSGVVIPHARVFRLVGSSVVPAYRVVNNYYPCKVIRKIEANGHEYLLIFVPETHAPAEYLIVGIDSVILSD